VLADSVPAAGNEAGGFRFAQVLTRVDHLIDSHAHEGLCGVLDALRVLLTPQIYYSFHVSRIYVSAYEHSISLKIDLNLVQVAVMLSNPQLVQFAQAASR
jgi:hypothetical protein